MNPHPPSTPVAPPPRRPNSRRACLVFALVLALPSPASAQTNVSPAQWLSLQPKPVFKPGHRLPLLSKFSWPFPVELGVELARNWGYALEFNGYGEIINGGLERDLANSNSVPARILAICTNNPGQFRLQVNLDRSWPTDLSRGFWVTNSEGFFVDGASNVWSEVTNKAHAKVVSPEASDSDLALQAESIAAPLRLVAAKASIAIVMNGGERDLGVPGFDRKAWQHDPRVQSTAVVTNAYSYWTNRTGLSWPRYISRQKARHLAHLTAAVRAAVPGRQHYVWYNTGNEQARFNQPGYDWENEWASWGWLSDDLNPVLDIPSFESYYVSGNSWTNAAGTPWSRIGDLLTRHLNAVAYNMRLGYTTNYSFVCGGWSNTQSNRLAEIERYTGFLKCLYTSGTIGATAGYFEFPTATTPGIFGNGGFAGSFPTNAPPHWLQQMVALSQVHAIFSHLDSFIYEGDLLSGPQKHVLSLDLPAYEFTNTVADATCRVLARKRRHSDDWLITAWAAHGDPRNVIVKLPVLGDVTVLAQPRGSIYWATVSKLVQLDALPETPVGLRVEDAALP